MTARGSTPSSPDSPTEAPRRSSPRLSIRRLVIAACHRWKKYREVYSKNIGRRSVMVIVPDDPPDPGDFIALWMGVDNLDMPRDWTEGEVIRLQPDAGASGESGVVIQLTAPEAEAIWCLIPRGDEDEVPLPRRLPKFPPPRVRHDTPSERPHDNGSPQPAPGQPSEVPAGLTQPAIEVSGRQDESDSRDTHKDLPQATVDQAPESATTRRSTRPTVKIKQSLDQAAARTAGTYSKHEQPSRRTKQKRRSSPSPQQRQRPSSPKPTGPMQPMNARPSKEVDRAPAVERGAAPIVGIDFGTTYSKVALFEGGEVTLIEDTSSTSSTRASVPSVVAFKADGSSVVGEAAQQLLAVEPGSVISSVKRLMGLSFTDPLANGPLASLACRSLKGPNDTILFDVFGKLLTVPEVVGRVLTHLRKMASDWIEADVREAVFTVPVDFDRRAKRELELAARIAGLEPKGFVPEPVAAAMGCGYDGSDKAFIAVYDFGGGTFDASVVEVGHERFVVRGTAGDRWLGGDDFDELMARYVADEFHRKTGVVLQNRAEEWQRLLFACEEAKRWLATLEKVDVVLPRATRSPSGPQTLLVPMTRKIFDEISGDIVSTSLEVCHTAARQASIAPSDVDALLITGGTTRIPAVRKAAQKLFQKQAAVGIHPQHAVVIGAAVRGAVISGGAVPEDYAKRLRGQDSVGHTIGLALAGGATEPVIDSSERAPVAAHRLYSTSRDDQTTIRIELVQGVSSHTKENRRVGGFVIDGLPKRKAGGISLDVYFELNTTGTLSVTAQERSTGQRVQGVFEIEDR